MVSIPDQEDMDLRIKQLTKGGSEESSNYSGDENQSDSQFLQKIRQDLNSKEQLCKPLNITLAASIISEIREDPLPKDILLKKLDNPVIVKSYRSKK